MLVTTFGVILCVYFGLMLAMTAPFVARYLIVQYRGRCKNAAAEKEREFWQQPQSSGAGH